MPSISHSTESMMCLLFCHRSNFWIYWILAAFMSNRITWSDDGEEPCLDIDVTLEVTLEVCSAYCIQHSALHYIIWHNIWMNNRWILAIKFILFFIKLSEQLADWYVDCNLQVYTKPFSMLPLSAVEKPGNLYVGLFTSSFRFPKVQKEQTLKDPFKKKNSEREHQRPLES